MSNGLKAVLLCVVVTATFAACVALNRKRITASRSARDDALSQAKHNVRVAYWDLVKAARFTGGYMRQHPTDPVRQKYNTLRDAYLALALLNYPHGFEAAAAAAAAIERTHTKLGLHTDNTLWDGSLEEEADSGTPFGCAAVH